MTVIWGHVLEKKVGNGLRVTVIAAVSPASKKFLMGYDNYEEMFEFESPEALMSMLEEGMDVYQQTDEGESPTFFEAAVRWGTPELVKRCIEKGANPGKIHPDAPHGSTLEAAAEDGNLQTLLALIEAGVTEDENGKTPLMYAAKEGDENAVKALIEMKADVNAQDADGKTPLIYALTPIVMRAYGPPRVNIVRILLEAGADVNVRTRLENRTPLMSSVLHPEIVKMLLDAGADVNAKDALGETALGLALRMADHFNYPNRPHPVLAVLPLLLKAGADIRLLAVHEIGTDASEPHEWLQKRIAEYGLIPFDTLEEGIEKNGAAALTAAVQQGMLFEGEKKAVTLEEISYAVLKHDWKGLTREYVQGHKDVAVRIFFDAIAEYNVELVKFLIGLLGDIRELSDLDSHTVYSSRSSYFSDVPRVYRSSGWLFWTNVFPEGDGTEETRAMKRKFDAGTEILNLLHEAGADVPVRDPRGEKLTYTLSGKMHARPIPEDDFTALSYALSPLALKALLNSGVDVNAKNEEGTSFLSSLIGGPSLPVSRKAGYFKPDEMVRVLLEAGAEFGASHEQPPRSDIVVSLEKQHKRAW